MITVIDLDIGNVKSVSNALGLLRLKHRISNRTKDIEEAEIIILTGVGNFLEASRRIDCLGIRKPLQEAARDRKIPFLGICLGMQLLADYSDEGGGSQGLGLIKARVVLHKADALGLRLPHIGWNDVSFSNFRLFDSVKEGSCFYFVHSYEMILGEKVKAAYSNYGADFVAAVQKDNILGVQFHPEKSQASGLQLLKNFCEGNF